MTFLQYFSKRFDICSSLLIELCIKKETGFVAKSPLIVYPQPIVLSRVSCLTRHGGCSSSAVIEIGDFIIP